MTFAILWGDVEEVLLFNKFFPIVDTCLHCEERKKKRKKEEEQTIGHNIMVCPIQYGDHNNGVAMMGVCVCVTAVDIDER